MWFLTRKRLIDDGKVMRVTINLFLKIIDYKNGVYRQGH